MISDEFASVAFETPFKILFSLFSFAIALLLLRTVWAFACLFWECVEPSVARAKEAAVERWKQYQQNRREKDAW